jgi:TolA-binding protein
MARLSDLGSAKPAESIALAREGNRRFKDSASAPERASIIVKSLSSLGRHDEAREEARKMERDYPNSSFTQDVHHHMFSNPPTHPTERGFGKKLELE